MKTSSHILVNPLRLLFGFMVLCPGQIFAAAAPAQAKAQLHVPWNLLQARLRTIVNEHGSDGSAASQPLGNRLISVPYDGEQIQWNLASGTVSSTVHADTVSVGPDAAVVNVSNSHVHIVLDSLSVDQVIEKNVGGVTVRVHLNAVCGPVVIDQASAAASSSFSLAWTGGAPSATLSMLDLRWAAGSWTFNDFTCTGPSGFDQLVRDGLASFLRDPSSLKPYVESYIAANLQSSIDATISKLRAPFAVGSGAEAITVSVGQLAPASTGVLADLTLRTDSKVLPLPALPAPSAAILKSLSSSQPALVGGVDVIEFIVGVRLAARSSYFRLNLQDVPAFKKLMHNRLAQLFAWQDLWHYPEDYPFYLNIANPRALTLKRGGSSSLSSTVPLTANIQSYRDSTWWQYVVTKGTSAMTVAVSVSRGLLSYSTTIDSLKISSSYGSAYAKKYNKKDAKLPDDVVSKAIVGPQKDLSGSLRWPDVDLDQAGQYRASSFTWVGTSTFSLNFAPVGGTVAEAPALFDSVAREYVR